jgi:hypothetical protein
MTSPTTGLDAMVFRPFKNMPFAGTIAVIVGASAAILFAVSWFRYIAGNDGFVRFYEQLYGFSILSAWIIVSALGVWMARKCSNAKTSVRVLGTGLTVAAGLGMLLICIKTITHIRYMDFPAKSTETLLEIAGTPHAQARDSAILELGIRRVTDAVPLLCSIMEEQHAARADRSSAANALGRICKYPCQSRVNKERVLTVLIAALRNDTSDPHGRRGGISGSMGARPNQGYSVGCAPWECGLQQSTSAIYSGGRHKGSRKNRWDGGAEVTGIGEGQMRECTNADPYGSYP